MPTTARDQAAVRIAMAASAAMIAFQVGGRATRDALFLSSYHVTDLPRMIAAAAAVSLLLAAASARLMGRWGPGRFLPALFAASATLLLIEFALFRVLPGPVSVAFYMHFNALGALLVSGFIPCSMSASIRASRSAFAAAGRCCACAASGPNWWWMRTAPAGRCCARRPRTGASGRAGACWSATTRRRHWATR